MKIYVYEVDFGRAYGYVDSQLLLEYRDYRDHNKKIAVESFHSMTQIRMRQAICLESLGETFLGEREVLDGLVKRTIQQTKAAYKQVETHLSKARESLVKGGKSLADRLKG